MKREERSPISKNAIIIPIVPIAAASWFSVSEETKSPIEINTMPTSKIATRLPIRTEIKYINSSHQR